MDRIVDSSNIPLNKAYIDELFSELNKEFRRKMKKISRNIKVDLYVVGGACVVAMLGSRPSTTDIDAMWVIGSDMREAINAVADRNGLSHNWCNCDFKRTKSFTNAIITNSKVYRTYDRLVVWMVKPDLLLAMKLVSFRKHKVTDMYDCINLINKAKAEGVAVSDIYLYNLVNKFYGDPNIILSDSAKDFISKFKKG